MALGGIVELFLGVQAEGATLEDIAQPLTSADLDEDGNDGGDDKEGVPVGGGQRSDEM